jgi:hypothetical protein
MALSFTNIRDSQGAAIYIIHDGLSQGEQRMKRLAEELTKYTSKQIVTLEAKSPDALKIIDFYDLKPSNLVLLVRDDDQLHQVWTENEIPSADQIAYAANQVG